MLNIFVALLDNYVRLYRIYVDNLLSTDDFFRILFLPSLYDSLF